MSSSETPTMASSLPNAASTARRSAISATQGAHHVAHTFTRRTLAAAGNTFAICAGSFAGRTSAASASRDIAANSTNLRIGPVHLHFDAAIRLILLRRFGVIAEQILRAEVLLQLRVRGVELLGAADDVGHAARLRGQRLHGVVAEREADADEVERHARRARVHEHVVPGEAGG